VLDAELTDFMAVQKRKAAEWRQANTRSLKEL
jgi:hypothetical protein